MTSELVDEQARLNTVLAVKVQFSVRLGSCQLSMRNVMEMTPGSIIQLDQHANDPVGLYVNEQLIAYGEVVVVEENFAIKVTQLVGKPGKL